MKRLALFLDGTWNDPGDNTNVSRLKTRVSSEDADGVHQVVRYQKGVGNRWGERLRGGALGKGLSRDARDAYEWLVENYEDGDEIFIFGFSRGAYTARTLAGMIARCGLLRPSTEMTADDVLDRYQKGKDAAPLIKLEFDQQDGRPINPEDQTLLDQSRRIDIEFIGVWDTVGALGVPFGRIRGLSRKSFGFHNTYPSTLYKNMFHAVAIDEHRKAFDATLWTGFEPDGTDTFKPLKGDQTLEQRWFIGDHGDAGGSGQLALIALAWIQRNAAACGLAFTEQIDPSDEVALLPHGDSFANFAFGLYRWLKLNKRHYRQMGRPPRPTATMAGRSHVLNETIDPSVIIRWQTDQTYRPQNLAEWADRTRTNLDDTSTEDPVTILTKR